MKCGELFARYDREKFSWKTVQTWLFEDLDAFLETFPKWGMMHDGELWEVKAWERPVEKGLGLWLTPTASDYIRLKFSKEVCLKSHRKKGNFSRAEGIVADYLEATGDFPHPEFNEWILDFPIGWTDLKPLEWRKFL